MHETRCERVHADSRDACLTSRGGCAFANEADIDGFRGERREKKDGHGYEGGPENCEVAFVAGLEGCEGGDGCGVVHAERVGCRGTAVSFQLVIWLHLFDGRVQDQPRDDKDDSYECGEDSTDDILVDRESMDGFLARCRKGGIANHGISRIVND